MFNLQHMDLTLESEAKSLLKFFSGAVSGLHHGMRGMCKKNTENDLKCNVHRFSSRIQHNLGLRGLQGRLYYIVIKGG